MRLAAKASLTLHVTVAPNVPRMSFMSSLPHRCAASVNVLRGAATSVTNATSSLTSASSICSRTLLPVCALSTQGKGEQKNVLCRASTEEPGERFSRLRRVSEAPQEIVLETMSQISKLEGRHARTTNIVIGGTVSPFGEDWEELDKKVNKYPTLRGFTAIGTGGDDFVKAMVVAVESVILAPIPQTRIRQRESAQGKYISVKIGPLRMESSSQVQAVYEAMRRDVRMRYFL